MKRRTSFHLTTWVRFVALSLLLGFGLLTGAALASGKAEAATTLTVSDCNDDSQLQTDINQANSDNDGDAITFSCSGDIKLSHTLAITGSMTIDGRGQSITLDGQNQTQVISTSSSNLTFNTLTIANGSTSNGFGGGIYNTGTVSIYNSTLSGNSTSGGLGGGIFNTGTVYINNSTLSNNSASGNLGEGGGIANYEGYVGIENSTIANNSATRGGGIYNQAGVTGIGNSTIADNSATLGGGIYIGSDLVKSFSSIVAENTGGDCENFGSIEDNGYSLDSDGSCGFTGTGSLQNANPQLSPLASNGGPTQTMALQPGSPAIDVIPTSTGLCQETDQRGDTRPDNGESACDMGAYESNELNLNGTTVNATEGAAFSGEVASGTYSGSGTLSATIQWGDGSHSRGTINGSSPFTVTGKHAYAEEGRYTISITVSSSTGDSLNVTSAATVSDAPLMLTSVHIKASKSLLAVLKASFTDADRHGQASDYTATINWGDGNTSNVTVTKNPFGKGFVLTGQHQYASKGTYSVILTVTDSGGSQATVTWSITI